MPRGVSDVYDPLQTRSSQRSNNFHPQQQQHQRQATLARCNTATSMSTFFFGRRRSSSSPPPRHAGVPDPPPNYEHVDAPSAQARLRGGGQDSRIAALRASKLVTVDKMSSADRMANWMERTDPEMSRMERWRRRVEEELRMEREEKELVAAAEAEVLVADADKALPDLPKSAFSNSNEDGDSLVHSAEGGAAFGLTRSDSTATVDTAVSAAVVATAKVLPSAKARSIYRVTLVEKDEPGAKEAAPPLPAQPVPTTSYRFPVGETAAFGQTALPRIDTSVRPTHAAGSSSLSAAQPKPWHGTPPPRSSSLPFNNLAQLSPPPPPPPPPQCSILPPKAAALLGLIPSATAPLNLRPPAAASFSQRGADSVTGVSSSRLATDTPPRPPFFTYDSIGGGSSPSRKDSIDTASLAPSTRTAGSFFSHNTPYGGFASAVAGRPSFESSTAPTTARTTASPQQTQSHLLPLAKTDRPFPLGVGSSFSAALAHSQARGATSRTKAPPRRLHLHKKGMSSSPDLTTPLKDQSPASMLPFPTHAQAQASQQYYGGDEEEVESLMDVPFYHHDPYMRGVPALTNQITAASLGGTTRGYVHRPPPRSNSLSSRDGGGGVVGTLVRSLSKSGTSTSGFLSRKLSKMSLRSEGEAGASGVGGGGGAAGGIRSLGRKLSFRRAEQAPPVMATKGAAAVRFAPPPTPLVENKVKRRRREEWEWDSEESSEDGTCHRH